MHLTKNQLKIGDRIIWTKRVTEKYHGFISSLDDDRGMVVCEFDEDNHKYSIPLRELSLEK